MPNFIFGDERMDAACESIRHALKGPRRGCCSGHPAFLTLPFMKGDADVIENAVLSDDFFKTT